MKSYVSDKHIRMVGKSWEIREQLRKLSAAHDGGRAELAALLPKLIGAPAKATGHAAPPRTRPQKTPDRRVIPFPSS
ncbi:Z-ring formation inhibitor MciZ [Paenibacillus flagellatus]|uniref:Z-ring formation inhibitor MciZ n=1 Tax=Paenibacillus flagellatus TaxID=2211139 RepID=A0A2V5KTG8_9BACL|nr:hypothetical protein DLM86_10830 [Paenibacillus flagellatus]